MEAEFLLIVKELGMFKVKGGGGEAASSLADEKSKNKIVFPTGYAC